MTTDDVLEIDAALLNRASEHQKRELRARMRAVRRVLPLAACSERSARAAERVLLLPEFERAQLVVGYCAMRKELDPSGLLARAAELGKQLGLPRVQDDRLTLHRYAHGDALVQSDLGMFEPAPDAPVLDAAAVDLILVPALALDTQGQRLGYGGGFYDRLLPTLPRAFRLGLIFDFQLVPELPRAAHDAPVQCVVSDARTLRV